MQSWFMNGRYMLTRDGHYLVASSYRALLQNGGKLECHDLIWGKLLQPKHRFILWLVAQKKLLTKDRMLGMGIVCDSANCVLCDKDELEDHTHLFVQCEWARAVWRDIEQWMGEQIPQQDTMGTLKYIKRRHWCKMKREVIAAIHGSLIYFTWQARNWKIFRGISVHTDRVIQQIQSVLRERIGMFIGSKEAGKCIGFLEKLCY
ncbi:uncharacterized protein LOC132624380 [Lycium barbarum]|uniref:uncharacterized protein LOC132624380 n=1 Tax=Lycium barbarum TaxID=112863 RepID=UPI00293E4075|nr:uncharacterized protein LOC132624380 [Lycium barbarum]